MNRAAADRRHQGRALNRELLHQGAELFVAGTRDASTNQRLHLAARPCRRAAQMDRSSPRAALNIEVETGTTVAALFEDGGQSIEAEVFCHRRVRCDLDGHGECSGAV